MPGWLPWTPAAVRRRAAIVDNGCVPPKMQYLAGAVVVLIFSGGGLSILFFFFCDLIGRDQRHRGMMNHAPISRQHFRRLDPFVYSKVGRDVDVLVVILTAARYRKLGNGQHSVRLDMPAFGEYRSRRQIFRIPFLGAGPRPGVDDPDFLVR